MKNFIDILKSLVKDDDLQLVFQNPFVFSTKYQNAVQQELLNKYGEEERKVYQNKVRLIKDLQTKFEQNIDDYPIGFGPIEKIVDDVQNGSLLLESAIKLAGSKNISELASQLYVKALSNYIFIEAEEGYTEKIKNIYLLMKSCVLAYSDKKEQQEMIKILMVSWIDTATKILYHTPDGRILKMAIEAGEYLLSLSDELKSKKLKGDTFHFLGVLHLDPYTVGRNSENYKQSILFWKKRFTEKHAQDFLTHSREELEVPEISEAIITSRNYLYKAAEIRKGFAKASTLKALIQALEWDGYLHNSDNKDSIVQFGEEALAILDPVKEPQKWLGVAARLQQVGEVIDVNIVNRIFSTSMDEYIQIYGYQLTIDIIRQALHLLENINKKNALELLYHVQPFIHLYGNDEDKDFFRTRILNLLGEEFYPILPDEIPNGGLNEITEMIKGKAYEENWDVEKLGMALLAVVLLSTKWDAERDAIKILDVIRKLVPVFANKHNDELTYFQGVLWMNEASNNFKINQFNYAIEAYMNAVAIFQQQNLLNRVADCFIKIGDVVERSPENIIISTVKGLLYFIYNQKGAIDETTWNIILKLCKKIISKSEEFGAHPSAFISLLQVSKGMQFAKNIYSGSFYNWQEDNFINTLLEQINETLNKLSPDNPLIAPPIDADALLDENELLTSYGTELIGEARDQIEESLLGLQMSFDKKLNQNLLSGASNSPAFFLSLSDIQKSIGKETVILNYYIGCTLDNSLALYLILITHDSIDINNIKHDFPDSLVQMTGKKHKISINPLALSVQSLRNEILLDPGPLAVSPEASKSLTYDRNAYFGYFWEKLDELKNQGYNHLCIIPHGPLHYYPFHLIGQLNEPLAIKWKVTYLPNLHLLTLQRGILRAKRYLSYEISSFGLNFSKGNKKITTLKKAVEEASSVAKIFGTKAILEDEVTKEKVLDRLQNSRYIHIATHGRINVDAPSFHSLFTSQQEPDSIIYAYELLNIDLNGVELITLSACETALGRFDPGDNLRGIPASLLLSGASSLIGTLWYIDDEVSSFFFKTLYKQLKTNSKDRIDSFYTAQIETKLKYPKYKDWGAFYFIGDWL